ncbi:MAG: aldehyde dehydrogenase family protein, partial [Moraxellaceae bacterium]|nr:aldehyde dehydrogenase family protein [Moraxellaceae bacterium]
MSRYLSAPEVAALNRLGDIICPGDDTLPSFSATGCVAGFDGIADYMGEADRADLKMLLGVLAFLPSFALRWVLFAACLLGRLPGAAGAVFRLLDFGLKGVAVTLYYGFADAACATQAAHPDVSLPPADAHPVRTAIRWDAGIRSPVSTAADLESPEEISPMNLPLQTTGPNLSVPDALMDALFDAKAVYARVHAGQASLRALSVRERLAYVQKLSDLVRDEREAIIDRIQHETGKSRTDALVSEIFPLLEQFEFLLKHAEKALADESVPTPLAMMGKKSRIYYEPLGTILVIAPWNYPFYQALCPIAAALV